jgi:hypothetical protein
MIAKTARKPSADPVQEKLRQDKALWNKGVSAFIANLINLKKTMNGSPSKYFKERSKIVQPIPANPAAIIDSLAGSFQELAQQGSAIVQEQLAYSKNRRPKQPKAPELPKAPAAPTTTPVAAPAAPAPDLSKQLAAWEQKYEMVVEGSNPLSRFLTRRLTRTKGTSEKMRINRMRLNMLNSCNKARKALNKLQVEVVKSSPKSITESNKLMKHVWDEWAVVARTFNLQKAKPEAEKETVELPTEEALAPSRETLGDEPNQLSKEETLSTPPPPNPYVPPQAPTPVEEEPDEPVEVMTEEQLKKKKIQDMVREVMKKTQPKPAVPAATTASAQMEITAQKFVKKWLGKKRHQFFSGNTSSYRLEIFELAKQARVQLNMIMNLLEKGFDTEAMSPLISQVNKQMTTMRMLMRSLHMSEKPDTTGGDGVF